MSDYPKSDGWARRVTYSQRWRDGWLEITSSCNVGEWVVSVIPITTEPFVEAQHQSLLAAKHIAARVAKRLNWRRL